MTLTEQISPELVLVDPALAELERRRERVVPALPERVVPLGVPLVPQESRAARPRWLIGLAGLALLGSGLLVALLLFRAPDSGGLTAPTTVVTGSTESPGAAAQFAGPPLPHP